jgi:hypothetical protein
MKCVADVVRQHSENQKSLLNEERTYFVQTMRALFDLYPQYTRRNCYKINYSEKWPGQNQDVGWGYTTYVHFNYLPHKRKILIGVTRSYFEYDTSGHYDGQHGDKTRERTHTYILTREERRIKNTYKKLPIDKIRLLKKITLLIARLADRIPNAPINKKNIKRYTK